ncbi:MAG: hypothetical protein ACQEXV_01840 [Bacillota bacterium]
MATAWYTFVPVFVDYGKINRKKSPKTTEAGDFEASSVNRYIN